MDTSQEYIKMCDKAREDLRPYRPAFDFAHSFYKSRSKRRLWLPRQDQLQEMVKSKAGDALHRICEFHDATCPNWKYYSLFTSLEQLWLAFVMKEKYSKIWNGTDWIKE